MIIRTAIVGLGRWGRRLVDSVQGGGPQSSAVRFIHGVVRTPADALEFAASHGLSLGTSYRDMLANPEVDAVVLATPHDQHAPQILEAIEAGKHVFVEKPLTLTFADTELAVKAARRVNRALAVGHNRRFLPAAAFIRELVDSGQLGTLVHVEGNFSNSSGLAYTPSMWRVKEAGSKAAMTAMGVHLLDFCVYLCGPIDAVSAVGTRGAMPVEVHGVVQANLHFKGGSTGYVSTMLTTPRQWRLQLFGTQGWIQMRDEDVLDVCDSSGELRTMQFPAVDTLRLELEAFADAASGKREFPIGTFDLTHMPGALEATLASSEANGSLVMVTGASSGC